MALSCTSKNDKRQIKELNLSSDNKLLDGLYVCEYSNSDYKDLRIFADHTTYSIHQSLGGQYSDPNLNLDYEVPMRFYLKDNFIYTFHLDEGFEEKLKDGTLIQNRDPTYRIISIDTFNDGYDVTQEIDIQYYTSEHMDIKLIKTIIDTVEREIKYHPGEENPFNGLYDALK